MKHVTAAEWEATYAGNGDNVLSWWAGQEGDWDDYTLRQIKEQCPTPPDFEFHADYLVDGKRVRTFLRKPADGQ